MVWPAHLGFTPPRRRRWVRRRTVRWSCLSSVLGRHAHCFGCGSPRSPASGANRIRGTPWLRGSGAASRSTRPSRWRSGARRRRPSSPRPDGWRPPGRHAGGGQESVADRLGRRSAGLAASSSPAPPERLWASADRAVAQAGGGTRACPAQTPSRRRRRARHRPSRAAATPCPDPTPAVVGLWRPTTPGAAREGRILTLSPGPANPGIAQLVHGRARPYSVAMRLMGQDATPLSSLWTSRDRGGSTRGQEASADAIVCSARVPRVGPSDRSRPRQASPQAAIG
jgi:hypothetical protein